MHSGLVREYCNWETFRAECKDPGQVVLMTSAFYGRMKYGRCVTRTQNADTKELHQMGCSEDIIK